MQKRGSQKSPKGKEQQVHERATDKKKQRDSEKEPEARW